MKKILLSLFVLTACSSAPPTDPPDPFADQAPEVRKRRNDESVLEGAPLEPAPSASGSGSGARSPSGPAPNVFRAAATMTNSFVFGGDPYACSWMIRMEQVVLDLHADATNGTVLSATLKALAVEETISPCTAPPYPPNEHVYTMTKATTVAPHVTRIELAPKATNEPQATATIDVDLSTPSATATIVIHRTDQPPPLDWTVKAKLSLESK